MKDNTESTVALPRHVGIIMDGNGRWAKQQGKSRIEGHRSGAQAVRRAIRCAAENHIEVLTLYAFSSENWSRPAKEVNALMELFMLSLQRDVKRLHEHGIRLKIIGDTSRFNNRLQKKIIEAQNKTEMNTGMTLNIAANYGGRDEIIRACQQLSEKVKAGELESSKINSSIFESHLFTSGQPDVDLLIRTSGEQRVSNFLLWQIAYAEFYFSDVLWPDFGEEHFLDALKQFSQRERRFGAV